MKKTALIAFTFSMFLATMTITSCGTKTNVPKGEERVTVFCSGPEYFSNNEFFRANSVGESPNQANSKRMAITNARTELAGQLEFTLNVVIDNYFKDVTVSEKQEFSQRYEGLTKEVITQKISGTRVICEELTRTGDGNYKTYIAIELSGNELFDAIDERISNDDLLKLDYDYERFKKTFEEEMKNFE